MSDNRFSTTSRNALAPIPFPSAAQQSASSTGGDRLDGDFIDECFDDVSRRIDECFDDVSRRIEVLARELGCLGYFDDDEDRPRAA